MLTGFLTAGVWSSSDEDSSEEESSDDNLAFLAVWIGGFEAACDFIWAAIGFCAALDIVVCFESSSDDDSSDESSFFPLLAVFLLEFLKIAKKFYVYRGATLRSDPIFPIGMELCH